MDSQHDPSVILDDVHLNEKLRQASQEYARLVSLLTSGNNRSEEFRAALVRSGELEELMRARDRLIALGERTRAARELLADPDQEVRQLAEEELVALHAERTPLEAQIRDLLQPRDPDDRRDALVEIRAGTGGEEAALFARDLCRMYTRYAEQKGFVVEPLDSHLSDRGGFSEVIFQIKGKDAYRRFKYESGVHRVQRVPETEAAGRIHTSAATVAVFPDVEDTQIKIDAKDLRIDTFCSSGAGGQHVNKTASAVRITHVPTDTVVSCQDERSQGQNRAKAMRILMARLKHLYDSEKKSKINTERKEQVKSGDRSEKIRTYNFPQNRVTDHRAGATLYNLDRIIDGDMDELLDQVSKLEN